MRIAIPTYKRAQIIDTLSLALLKKCSIPNESVYLFLSNAEEYKEYSYLLQDGYNLVYTKDLYNLQEKHNYIQDYFDVGERIIVMEDDIRSLKRKDDNRVIEYTDFKTMVQDGWHACDKKGTKLWGIYPIPNGMFMSESITSDLVCITGYLFGIEITKDKFLRCNTENKHDYERSILHYIKYGSVCRLDYIAQYSQSFTGKGGLQAQHTNSGRCENEIKGCEYLTKRFPHLIARASRINKVFGAQTELRMRSIDTKGNKTDFMALQKIIDKKIKFVYE